MQKLLNSVSPISVAQKKEDQELEARQSYQAWAENKKEPLRLKKKEKDKELEKKQEELDKEQKKKEEAELVNILILIYW